MKIGVKVGLGVCALGGFIFAMGWGCPRIAAHMNEDNVELIGDSHRYQPLGALPGVLAYAGKGSQLVEMCAFMVEADGSVNLHAEYQNVPRVNYDLVRSAVEARPAGPLGSGGGGAGFERVDIDVQKPGTYMHITRRGGDGCQGEWTELQLGMQRSISSAVGAADARVAPSPECTLADVWQRARDLGVPGNAVAVINYDRSGFNFWIQDTDIRLELDSSCTVLRASGEGVERVDRGRSIAVEAE